MVSRWLVPLVLCWACLVPASWASPRRSVSGQEPVPRIDIPKPVFNFGKVFEGTVVTHDFTVANKGTATLVIRQVRPD